MTEGTPARVDGLEVHEVDDGLVVYQLDADRVHYLSPSAAVIFELCTGEHTAEQITELVRAAWDLGEAPTSDVVAGLEQLRSEGLIR